MRTPLIIRNGLLSHLSSRETGESVFGVHPENGHLEESRFQLDKALIKVKQNVELLRGWEKSRPLSVSRLNVLRKTVIFCKAIAGQDK